MRTYLYCEAGFVEKAQWLPNSWVNVVCPNNDDFEFLTQTLNVPESFLNDIADTDERPRTDTEGNWLLTILRIPVVNKQNGSLPFDTVPIGIITNNEIIVSVCYHNTDLLPDFIEHTRRKGIVVRNKLDLIFRLIYSSAVWFLKYLKQINIDISAAEKELERSIRNEDLLRLMRLQKTLVYFNTSIRGNEVMIGKLRTIFQDTDYLDTELVEDVIIELKQALNTVNIYSDILTGTMDAFASIISNNVNTIMKRMTSLSIVLILIATSAVFGNCLTMLHVPDLAANAITSVTSNPYIIALLIDLIILVLGMIMDMAPIILIATPILLPIATSIGIDPIQFGIIMVLNCGIGLLTPPVGAVLFIGSAVAKRPMEKVVKATLPFYLCMFIALLLLTFVPDISLAIPKLLGGYVSPIANPLGPVFIH